MNKEVSFWMMALLILSSACYFAFSIASTSNHNALQKLDDQIVKPRINYTEPTSIENKCKYPLTPDFYGNMEIALYSKNSKYNGQTCPIRI